MGIPIELSAIDEKARFDIWHREQVNMLIVAGESTAARNARQLEPVYWSAWQARAKLNGESKVVLPERRLTTTFWPYLTDADQEWNACLNEVERLNGIEP